MKNKQSEAATWVSGLLSVLERHVGLDVFYYSREDPEVIELRVTTEEWFPAITLHVGKGKIVMGAGDFKVEGNLAGVAANSSASVYLCEFAGIRNRSVTVTLIHWKWGGDRSVELVFADHKSVDGFANFLLEQALNFEKGEARHRSVAKG